MLPAACRAEDLAVIVRCNTSGALGVSSDGIDHPVPEVTARVFVIVRNLNVLCAVKTEAVSTAVDTFLHKRDLVILNFGIAGVKVGKTVHTVVGNVIAALPVFGVHRNGMPAVFVVSYV